MLLTLPCSISLSLTVLRKLALLRCPRCRLYTGFVMIDPASEELPASGDPWRPVPPTPSSDPCNHSLPHHHKHTTSYVTVRNFTSINMYSHSPVYVCKFEFPQSSMTFILK